MQGFSYALYDDKELAKKFWMNTGSEDARNGEGILPVENEIYYKCM